MKLLIIKLGATGDVVRTTPLLRKFLDDVVWITDSKNLSLLQKLELPLRALRWEDRGELAGSSFDLVINLEDELEVARFLDQIKFERVFGAYRNKEGQMSYTDDSAGWFDLSLISRFGREQADFLKLQNRRTYQDLLFEGLGLNFQGETYLLPKPPTTDLEGDIALSPVAGAVWPMKNWAYYPELQSQLEAEGLRVNVLPRRDSMLEHLGDVANHRLLISGDSLPMHLALGLGRTCVSLFTCTSPWEICDYSLQKKIISPLLEEFFYRRGMDERATTAINPEQVFETTMALLNS